MKCSKCGKTIVSDGIAAGYGIDRDGNKICYDCCAEMDKADLDNLAVGEKTVFYLTHQDGKYEIVNWPGSLRIPCSFARVGRHNIAGTRTDVDFSFNGKKFHGTQYGDNSEICYIRRVKGVA